MDRSQSHYEGAGHTQDKPWREVSRISSLPNFVPPSAMISLGAIDRHSLVVGIASAALFFSLGAICVELSRFGAALASVWLPAAACVVLLLTIRPSNEAPFHLGVMIGCLSANIFAGHSMLATGLYTSGNVLEILLIVWLVRRGCGVMPDMTDVRHLGRFLLYGGIVGPCASTALISIGGALLTGFDSGKALQWFLVHSMGMILIAPAAMLALDAVEQRTRLDWPRAFQSVCLMGAGVFLTHLVFAQNDHSLMFLVAPATLLMAFKVGSLGTAIYVPLIALVASYMTMAGYGPVVSATQPGPERMYLLQAFFATNYLTGLPIAAILNGRERLISQLAAQRAELSLLTENVTDAVIRIDGNGMCTYASPSVREVLKREPRDVVGKFVPALAHQDATQQIAQVLDKLLNGKTDKERLTYRRLEDAEDGTPVFIEADAAAAFEPSSGERCGIVVSARDVTERVELEVLLTRARREAEDAAQTKSEFLANMSHEIRTPMNGVLGFAELMLQGNLDDENRRHTEMIVQSGRSMMLLLNDILDLSKIEAGQITIDEAPVDLIATINECAVLHRPVAEKKGLELRFHADCAPLDGCDRHCGLSKDTDNHSWIVTDALRLRQIVLNLIGNAVKFTDRGRVEIACDVSDETVTITVSDTGIGIAAARLETIFAPFTQGETDIARRFGGTGLGLSISRQLAELLGGTIEVESEPDIGSTFRLMIPTVRAPLQTEMPQPVSIPPVTTADIPLSSRILLVEDHDVNRILGVEMLERCGQNVSVAHDGNEAIAMVIDSVMRGKPFDLVLMDIQMPECDGYAATKAIREEGINADTMPIIALTANAFAEDIKAARDAGMQAHLSKPLEFTDLANVLLRWLPTRIIEADNSDLDHQEGGSAEVVSIVSGRQGLIADRENGGGAKPQMHASGESPPARSPAHSPALVKRWNNRRSEAIEAVRRALEQGVFEGGNASSQDGTDDLARLIHKLAGTAAIFGEPELGDKAAALERALRHGLQREVCEALAFELLSVADDPADTFAQAGG